jgi:phage shock protein PspC (stress-responsive transcriptional regulator)
MKKVININFQGAVVPIEESSYELLKQYIESLRRYFANEEGKDEIINDIESRISELFQERLKAGSTCITDDDVNAIIKNMGRPEEFEQADNGEQATNPGAEDFKSESTIHETWNRQWKGKSLHRDENNKILGGVCSGIAAYFGIDPIIVRILFIVFGFTGVGFLLYILLWIFVPGSNMLENGVRKRLYRNPDGKIIGGVCSGIGAYFNFNPWLARFIFLIPFFTFVFRWGHWGPNFFNLTFSPGSLIVYIILWLVIPEATTTSEKLEMKGEKVDLNSIKNSVLQEMKEVGVRVGKLGAQAGEMAKDKGPAIGQEIHMAARRSSGVLGNIIVTIFKVFIYFILGCIAVALIIALFALAIAAIGLFPLKDFVLTDGWQSVFAWGTLIFFIGVPVVGIITFIIRRIARVKNSNKLMRYSFIGLWILGIICFISLITSVGRDFRSLSSVNSQPVTLSNPTIAGLHVEPFLNSNYNRGNNWFRLEPFAALGFEDDTAFISNIKIRIQKSLTDSFEVYVSKSANGRSRRYADTTASLINFNISQNDSLLMMDRAIPINTTDKFRNQYVEVTIGVPVGHQIEISKSFRNNMRVRFEGFNNGDDWYWYRDDEKDYDYKYGVTYVMKEDGLYTLNGISSERQDEWDDNSSDDNTPVPQENNPSYRYDSSGRFDSLKNEQEKKIERMQAAVDSMKAARDKEVERTKDSLRRAKEEIDRRIEKLDKGTALHSGSLSSSQDRYSFIMNI